MSDASTPDGPGTETTGDAGRTWVEFDDPADAAQRFRCDLTWLTSTYRCIFGCGCPGIDADRPDDGCCTLGAHFTDEDDVTRVAAVVDDLGDDEWQYRSWSGESGGWSEPEGDEVKTRVVDGACVFLNRPGFPAGAGCALHQAAVVRGVEPLTAKPDVCWQLPLRRTYRTVTENDGTSYLETSIGEYRRRDWGPGGHDFDWYCTSSPLAHAGGVDVTDGAAGGGRSGSEPLFRSSEAELRELMGDQGYAELAARCEVHLAAVAALVSSAGPIGPAGLAVAPGGRALLPLLVHPATLAARGASAS
ncbi:hypothetical protein [Agilicoccus flavus]|uniref:hypothetical protein n=1 Tax=Agilicoccus flavus TaxID=2775968 RepID=UPI001CF636A1|nr:hypothetical protein [Agilicoccus flavus]